MWFCIAVYLSLGLVALLGAVRIKSADEIEADIREDLADYG
jgi:hypothetical protein